MQANPDDRMEQAYQNLTEKQRAVIDAHAENPDATNRDKARIAGEEILGQDGPVNESYCSEILNKKYEGLAQYREEIVQNERGQSQGQVETTGDPFANMGPDHNDVQTIDERPVKDIGSDDGGGESGQRAAQQRRGESVAQQIQSQPIQVADVGDGIVVKLDYQYVQSLLESQDAMLPADLHQQLVDVVVQQAFQ